MGNSAQRDVRRFRGTVFSPFVVVAGAATTLREHFAPSGCKTVVVAAEVDPVAGEPDRDEEPGGESCAGCCLWESVGCLISPWLAVLIGVVARGRLRRMGRSSVKAQH